MSSSSTPAVRALRAVRAYAELCMDCGGDRDSAYKRCLRCRLRLRARVQRATARRKDPS